METSMILISLTVLCAFGGVASAMVITRSLDQRGMPTPFPFLLLFLFRNLERFKTITRNETGKVGWLFYSYLVSMNAALVLAVIAVILRIKGM